MLECLEWIPILSDPSSEDINRRIATEEFAEAILATREAGLRRLDGRVLQRGRFARMSMQPQTR